MAIVNQVQMEFMIHVQELTCQFENMTVVQFKDKNVHNYCTTATNLLLELKHQDQLHLSHLMTIIKHFFACLCRTLLSF